MFRMASCVIRCFNNRIEWGSRRHQDDRRAWVRAVATGVLWPPLWTDDVSPMVVVIVSPLPILVLLLSLQARILPILLMVVV